MADFFVWLTIVIAVAVLPKFGASIRSKYVWFPTEEWSPCSKPCGYGEETVVYTCVKNTTYGTMEHAPIKKCSSETLPVKIKTCSLGSCPNTTSGSFVWQTTNWTKCARTCGGGEFQSREVNCYFLTTEREFLVTKLSFCDSKLEPNRFISCANADCTPQFFASKWEKCPISQNCNPTIRRRNVQCISLLHNGTYKVVSQGVCYRLGMKPPSGWSTCYPDINENCQTVKRDKNVKNKVVSIDTESSEIHQMRLTKRMKVIAGETAYIFGFTRVSIACPTKGFLRKQIEWSHKNKHYAYSGRSSERVKVNRKGQLLIRSFLLYDEGVWTCHAGKSTASATLRHELPSIGYVNWLNRYANRNYGMLNEESKESFVKRESVNWMETQWSPCSITCLSSNNNVAKQRRNVRCEKIEPQHFKIIEDKYCDKSRKPDSEKNCTSIASCPAWKVNITKPQKCTDDCYDIGLAKTNSKVFCEYRSGMVDDSLCNKTLKPNITCQNERCEVEYLYGSWSPCSHSCSNETNIGIASRTVNCIWKHNKKPAHHLCSHINRFNDKTFKSCRVPKCILACKDLSPACIKQDIRRCSSSFISHMCCAHCKKNVKRLVP